MKFFKRLADSFSALQLRDRIIAIVAVGAAIALGGNLLLLKPQQLAIDDLKAKHEARNSELAQLRKLVVEIRTESERGIDPLAAERARLADLTGKIDAVDQFIKQVDSGGHRLGGLLRAMVKSHQSLTLVSLRSIPGQLFYSPPAPPPPPKKTVSDEVDKILAPLKKSEAPKPSVAPVLVKSPIYKHGVELSVKGTYPALIAYLGELQGLQRRIFWSSVEINAANHREAQLNMVIFALSQNQVTTLD